MKTFISLLMVSLLAGIAMNSAAVDPGELEKASAPLMEEDQVGAANGGFVKGAYLDIDLKKGDRLLYSYCAHSDSGVQLERTAAGKVLWRVHVKGLEIKHSKYYHAASVKIGDGKITVISDGARRIIETRDLKTGRQLSREVVEPPPGASGNPWHGK